MVDVLSEKPLRFLCFGMGAIGTYIGGSLLLAGNEVTFIERPEAVTLAKSKGLSLHLPDGLHLIPNVMVYSSLEEAMQQGTYDAALVAVKSFDTLNLAESVRPWKGQFPVLICLQNGVENETAYESVLGAGQVIGASIASAVSKDGTGEISVEKMRGIGVQTGIPLSQRIIDAFNQAGLNAKGYSNRANLKWSKMLTNLLGNATSAILNWTPAQVFSNQQVYKIEVEQVRETLAVMQRLHIHLVNLPGTPIRPLIRVMELLPLSISRPISYLALGKGRGAKMPSFHIDLYAGQKQSEVTYLNGAVVRAGKRLGIETPVNQTLTEILEGLANGTLDKKSFNDHPEEILARVSKNK
jgi:2-dehydropantoate 2-reductase